MNSQPLRFSPIPVLLLALSLAGSVRAAFIPNVRVAAVSLEYSKLTTSTPEVRGATNLVRDVGLFGDSHTTIPGGSMWLAASSAGAANAGTNFIVFDLGALHTVDAMKVWNYNENNVAGTQTTGTNQGVKLANISYSADGLSFTTNLPSYTFNLAPGTVSAFGQTIPMGGVSARFVRIDILTNWSTTANKPVGLSKVRFIDNTVPPVLVSASQNYGSNQVTVVFSESVDPVSATNKANYSLQSSAGSPVILSATLGQPNDRVILQTTPLTNQNYTLSASGVYDLAHVITITNNSTVAVNPELILWLKADAGTVADSSGNLSQWNDQSGYGHNALVAAGSNQPVVLQGVVNGQSAISFDGSSQCLEIPATADLAINGDMAVCLVLDSLSAAAPGDPISRTGGQANAYSNNMPAPFDIQLAKTSGKPTLVWGNPAEGAPTVSTAGGGLAVGQNYIVAVVVHGTNISWYLNGSFNGSTLLPYAPADDGKPIRLGIRLDNGARFNGYLAEAMLFRGSVTPADLVALHNYLGPKYGIPITTLAITELPASTTAQVGQKATFWVNAVGVPPVTYQWKTNGVNIAGATSAIYTTPTLNAGFNGLTYTVTVTTPVGATNSPGATLTVMADTTPPAVFSATKTTNAASVVVAYSEAVALNATNPASYALSGGASVLSAAYGSASNQVVLTTTALDPATGYYLTVQNVQDLFGNTLARTTVPVLPANLSLYLRADAGVVLDNSGLVAQWLDQTTNANNAVQFSGGASARPSTGLNTINGQPVLSFNANASNYLQAASSPSLALTGDLSIYAVANFSDYSAPREILGKTAGNQPASYDYYISSGTDFRLYRGNGTVNAVGRATAAPSTGQPHVLAVTMAGTNVAHFLDGKTNGTAGLQTTLGDGGTALRIGSRNDLAQFMNGDLAEVMLFSAALSPGDRVAIDNYLGAKYYPFAITQQPAAVTTTEGVTASFSVAATQGSAHFAYQWRQNGLPIAGATNTTYTTPVLAPGDNGETFDVVITLPSLSTNVSAAATLTVNNVPLAMTSAGIPLWSRTNIVLLFFEAVDPATVTSLANYSLDNGAGVLGAAIGDAPNKVVLTTSPLSPGTAYTLTVSNLKDAYNNMMATVNSPLGVYPPSTALWLKADTGVVADPTSGLVTEWDDQSGNANNLVAGYPPLLVPNVLNSRPVVRFDGYATYLYANSSSSLAITSNMSIFAVVTFSNLTSGGTQGMIVSKTTGNQPAPFDYYVRSSAVQFYRGNGTVNAFSPATTVPSLQAPHLMGVVMQGTAVTHRLDGNANGAGTLNTTIGDNGDPLFIGSRGDYANHLNGDMAELIVLSSALSSNDVTSLESYLGAKYNFPLGTQAYPRITLEPVARTNVNQNSTVVIAAAATGNPAVTYQWYDANNLAVAGQTNASLVLSNVQTSGSYYLQVGNIFGTTNSSVVTVTVFSGPPQVTLTPDLAVRYAGRPYTCAVTANGTAPLSYQWSRNGNSISGATDAAYTLLVPLGTNVFSCTVTNSLGTGPNASVTLIGITAPNAPYPVTVLGDNPIAYWRLDEATGNALAYDYAGGHACLYTNVQLGVAGYGSADADTAALFGSLQASNSFAGEVDSSAAGTPYLDFAQPTGADAAFSVEAWVNSSAAQSAGAGIVTKGYGNGGEQFDLDYYSGFRFFVRDAAGGVHSANSSVVPTAGQWYHLLGVWDGPHGAVRLYVNGVESAAVTNLTTGLGLKTVPTNAALPAATLVSIGARVSNQTSTNYDFQFKGPIDEVALYNYALSSNQVSAHYQAAVLPPRQPLTLINQGGGHLQLNWNFGTLQSATNVAGPFADLPSAVSPYLLQPTNTHQFYRVREK